MEPHLETICLKPSDIRFSREEIPGKFSNYGDINQSIIRLTLNPRLINTVPPISVSNRNDGEWHTENNRRLYMFRALEKLGVLENIEVNILPRPIVPCDVEEGCHVRIRGKEKTLPHCECANS